MPTPASNIDFLSLSTSILSNDAGHKTRFVIVNTSNAPISVYWIDRAGVDISYGQIPPGASRPFETFSGHAWKVTGADGTTGFKFFPTLPGSITVGAGTTPGFTDFSEHVSHTALGDWSTAQGYGLINVAKALGVPDLGNTLPMTGQNNNIALNLISASSAWAAGYTGKGVKVAVVDIGIASHPEIDARISGGYDILDHDNDPRPSAGAYVDHALGVASIIAASHDAHAGQDTMGVAPDASLLSVRIGDGNNGSANVAAGIRWAVDNGAKVISLPLGSGSPEIDTMIGDAVHYAYQHNVLVVIAGGNNSNYGPTGPALIAQSGEAIAVGNLNALAATPFDSSNQPGATPFPWVMANSSGYLPVPDGGYAFREDGGTSFAGPYVAGLAALLIQQSPNASVKDIIASIIRSADIGASEATAALDQRISGTAKADLLQVTKASASMDGGAGIDTAQFTGSRAGYVVSHTKEGFVVTSTNPADGSVSLVNVERLAFSDTSLAIDIEGNGGMVYRLYQAAFGRVPDAAGLGFWIRAKDAGQSLDDIAGRFLASDEAVKLYGAHPSNAALLQAVYQNVLHRAPDQAGYDYWMGVLDQGHGTPAQLLTAFSESAENRDALADVIGNGFVFTPYL